MVICETYHLVVGDLAVTLARHHGAVIKSLRTVVRVSWEVFVLHIKSYMFLTEVLLEVLGWLVVTVGSVVELHPRSRLSGHRAPRVGVHCLRHHLLPLVSRSVRLRCTRALAGGRWHSHHTVRHHSVLGLE